MSEGSKTAGFMGKMKNLGDKMKTSSLHDAHVKATHLKHNMGKFANIINPNHRHDEEHEKRTDAKRTRRAEDHRFNSFAPERDGNNVKWYVDARDYFWVSVETGKMYIICSRDIRTYQLPLSVPRRRSTLRTGGYRPNWYDHCQPYSQCLY